MSFRRLVRAHMRTHVIVSIASPRRCNRVAAIRNCPCRRRSDDCPRRAAAMSDSNFRRLVLVLVFWIYGTNAYADVPGALPEALEADSATTAMSASAPLTVEALVAEVLSRNPGLAAMRAAADASAARAKQASSLPDPMLSMAVAPETLGRSYSGPANYRVEFSQGLPWPGKLHLKGSAAQYEAEASNEDVAAMRLKLVALTKSAYADWYFAHRALAINARELDLVNTLRDTAVHRYAAGTAAQQDVLLGDLERSRLRQRNLELTGRLDTARAQIDALLGVDGDAPLAPPTAALSSPHTSSYEALRAAALTRHPELVRIQDQLAAQRSRLQLAHKAFLPDFSVSTGYNRLWDETEKRWTIGIGISLPIDLGRRRAAVREAEANIAQAQAGLTERRSQLLAELAQAQAWVTTAGSIIELYERETLPQARDFLGATRLDYVNGRGSFLNVMEAERRLLDIELGLEQARAQKFQGLAELERWAGGPSAEAWPTASFDGNAP